VSGLSRREKTLAGREYFFKKKFRATQNFSRQENISGHSPACFLIVFQRRKVISGFF
jgi:hypothetical protein